MRFSGLVKNGVVVFDGERILAEGTPVMIVLLSDPVVHVAKRQRRVEFPLVKSDRPGTLHLTNERIAEIQLEDDLASYRSSFRKR